MPRARGSSAYQRFVAVGLSLGVLALFLAVALTSVPNLTAPPSVSVKSASWVLEPSGYTLVLNVSTSDRVSVVGVEAGGSFRPYTVDISPPGGVVAIPGWARPEPTVRVHLSAGPPVSVDPANPGYQPQVQAAFGPSSIYIYGVVPSEGLAVVTPVYSNVSVLVVVEPNGMYKYYQLLENLAPWLRGLATFVDASNMTPEALSRYSVIVFADVAPEPRLLSSIPYGVSVVLHAHDRSLGELRLSFNGSRPVFRTVPPQEADVDYIGAHCVQRVASSFGPANAPERLRWLFTVAGAGDAAYGILPADYCRSRAQPVVLEDSRGFAVVARVGRFWFSSLPVKHTVLLAAAGWFSSAYIPQASVYSLKPFKGFYPVPVGADVERAAVLVLTGGRVFWFSLSRPEASASPAQGGYALRIGSPGWSQDTYYRVELYGASYTLYQSMGNVRARYPTTEYINASPGVLAVLYINGTPSLVVGGDEVASFRPVVSVEKSTVCEFFSMRVYRADSSPVPTAVRLNGAYVGVIRGGGSYTTTECRAFVTVELVDPLGRVVYSETFQVQRFYQTPLFAAGVLGVALVGSTIAAALAHRRKSPAVVYIRLPAAPEAPPRVQVTASDVEDSVSRARSALSFAPTAWEVFWDIYRRFGGTDAVRAAAQAIAVEGRARVVSRYQPELGDTVSVVVRRGEDALKELYARIVREAVARIGCTAVNTSGMQGELLVDIDLVIECPGYGGGRVVLLATIAPSPDKVRQAVDRALTALVRARRLSSPATLAGVVVFSDSAALLAAADAIDRILSGDSRVALEVLSDATVKAELEAAPRESWLRHYIVTACPVYRVEALAFAREGSYWLANQYYRRILGVSSPS